MAAKPFKTLKEVWKYLKDQGFQIEQSTVYLHRKQGKFKPNANGEYPRYVIDKYAIKWIRDGYMAGVKMPKEIEDVQVKKARAEAEKAEAQARHWEMKTEQMSGTLIDKSIFESELATRASIFKSDIENFFRARAAEVIGIVNGDISKAPDLIDFQLKEFEKTLNRYSEENKEWNKKTESYIL